MRTHWLDVLHVLDSSFPTGGYVHSYGLESFSAAREELQDVLRLRVEQSLARLDLVFVLHAYAGDLVALDVQYHTLQLVREPREASAGVGTNLLRSVTELLSHPRLLAFARDGQHRHHAIVFGAVAAALEMPRALAGEAYAFGSVRAQVSAAQRLGWIGQRQAQRLLQTLKPALTSAVEEASRMDLQEAGAFAPMWDIACMAHEHADVRMFAS
jgi:urease accessory protein